MLVGGDDDNDDIVASVYGEAVSSGRIRPDPEADGKPSSCPEVKNVWEHTSIALCSFMMRHLVTGRYKF
jgi:hypothetical protein